MELPRTAAIAGRLQIVAASASTNAELRESTDAPHLSILVTDDQTAGRGRLDRVWTAPAGSALAVSVLLRELPAPDALGWIPLAAGLAMADAVAAQLPAHEVGVKWPNDVLVDGRKICGILAEAAQGAVIVGAGVNTTMTAAQLPIATATSFAVLDAVADADALIRDFVTALDRDVRLLRSQGDADASGLRDRVQERCVSLGRDVEVSLPDGTVLHGRATGLEPDGMLIVEAAGERHSIAAGDVVHARLA